MSAPAHRRGPPGRVTKFRTPRPSSPGGVAWPHSTLMPAVVPMAAVWPAPVTLSTAAVIALALPPAAARAVRRFPTVAVLTVIVVVVAAAVVFVKGVLLAVNAALLGALALQVLIVHGVLPPLHLLLAPWLQSQNQGLCGPSLCLRDSTRGRSIPHVHVRHLSGCQRSLPQARVTSLKARIRVRV